MLGRVVNTFHKVHCWITTSKDRDNLPEKQSSTAVKQRCAGLVFRWVTA